MWLSMPKVNAECEKPETQNTVSFINNRAHIKRGATSQHKYLSEQHNDNVLTSVIINYTDKINGDLWWYLIWEAGLCIY